MSKLEAGCSYLIKITHDDRWYLVQRMGQKTWVATSFTHSDAKYYTGNSIALYEELVQLGVDELHICYGNKYMRTKMFSILKYGKVQNENN